MAKRILDTVDFRTQYQLEIPTIEPDTDFMLYMEVNMQNLRDSLSLPSHLLRPGMHNHAALPVCMLVGEMAPEHAPQPMEVACIEPDHGHKCDGLNDNEYECCVCTEVFVKGVSDEEAVAEHGQLFPGHDIDNSCLVCDDCFNTFKKGGPM
jgi:hypothetical protein